MFHMHFAVPENDFHESYEQYEWAMEAADEIVKEHMARHIHPRNPAYDRRVQEMLRDLERFMFAPCAYPGCPCWIEVYECNDPQCAICSPLEPVPDDYAP